MNDTVNHDLAPEATPAETARQSGWHPVNVGHLVMGTAFLGLALVWLLLELDVIATHDLRWFLPLPWLAAGLAGLAGSALAGRRSGQPRRPDEV